MSEYKTLTSTISLLTNGWRVCEGNRNLPPKFKPVLCLLTNDCLAIDWVNQPENVTAPFARYLVYAWVSIDITTCIDIVLKIPQNHIGTELDPTLLGYKIVADSNDN